MSFQALIPNINLSPEMLQSRIEVQMIRFNELVYNDFRETISTWKNNSRMFTKKVFSNKRGTRGEVVTGSDRYRYVNNGTPPHRIVARNARSLRFRTGYRAKTSPGNLIARPGGSSGGFRFARAVNHPGIQARNFDKEIKALREKDFLAIMSKALFEELK